MNKKAVLLLFGLFACVAFILTGCGATTGGGMGRKTAGQTEATQTVVVNEQ